MPVPPDEAERDHPSPSQAPLAGATPDVPLDRATLIARFGGDVGFFEEVAAIFLEDFPRMLSMLHDARAAGDLTALRGAAHAFKGAVSHFSSGATYQAAAALEQLAEAGRSDAFDAVERVETRLRELASAIAVAQAASSLQL